MSIREDFNYILKCESHINRLQSRLNKFKDDAIVYNQNVLEWDSADNMISTGKEIERQRAEILKSEHEFTKVKSDFVKDLKYLGDKQLRLVSEYGTVYMVSIQNDDLVYSKVV